MENEEKVDEIDMKKLAKISMRQVIALEKFAKGKISEYRFKAITRSLNKQRKKLGVNPKPICGMEGLSSTVIGDKEIVGFTEVLKKVMKDNE